MLRRVMTAAAVGALLVVPVVEAFAEELPAHQAVIVDTHGAPAATRPGYTTGYVDAVAKSNAKQPVKSARHGFVVVRLPKQGRTQGWISLNGSNATGEPNRIATKAHGKRIVTLRQAGYLTVEANGFDPSSAVSVYLIANATPTVATLISNLTTSTAGELGLSTLSLPAGIPLGNATVEVVGTQLGRTTAVVVGVRLVS